MDPNVACNSTNLNNNTTTTTTQDKRQTPPTFPNNHHHQITTNNTTKLFDPMSSLDLLNGHSLFSKLDSTTSNTTTSLNRQSSSNANAMSSLNPLAGLPIGSGLASNFLLEDIKSIDDPTGSLTGCSTTTPMDINGSPATTITTNTTLNSTTTTTSSNNNSMQINGGHHHQNNPFALNGVAAASGGGGLLGRNKMSINSNLNKLHQTASYQNFPPMNNNCTGNTPIHAHSNNNING